MEYACVVCSPYFQTNMDALERVQHKFYKILEHDYTTLENELSLAPLSKHRDQFGAEFIFKLVHGKIDCPSLWDRIAFHLPYEGIRHQFTFQIPDHRTTYRANCPLDRSMSVINDSNFDIFNITLSHFKTILGNWDNVIFVLM